LKFLHFEQVKSLLRFQHPVLLQYLVLGDHIHSSVGKSHRTLQMVLYKSPQSSRNEVEAY
jgi:hypothetical protein